ncbi:MAG: hypothetical protein N2507_02410 [Candidatus Bipolaricaulota bacterium]|nr:hypothetical protein [Candidatus Bipolaricaulota bacterium]MCX7844201.1 hypothetical protein [Candidatus Bipolaricaulota bacterium]MDW8152017.1 hypothetical protein [Candidatus Bipolaricaulota bacterium]
MRTKRWVLALAALALPVWAQEFAGSVGMDFLFAPDTPLEVDAAFTLALELGPGRVESRTVISLEGLEAEHLWLWWRVPGAGVTLRTGFTFDPCFSRWALGVSGGCCPFLLSGWFYLGNLAPACQTPNYTIGLVLDFGVGGEPGFLARSLIGFGVTHIYHLIDDDPWTDVVLVPGWYFEEALLHFAWSDPCWRLYTTWMFTYAGLGFGELGVSYRFLQPVVELAASLRVNSAFALDWAKLYLGITVDPVSIYSATAFNFAGFLWQEVGLRIQFAQVLIYSATRFDLAGLEWIKVGFELRF